MNLITEAILNRRSIYPREYTGEAIPEEMLMQAFEAANWAPTHKKTQPWHFLVFSGKGKDELVDFWVKKAMESTFEKGETWNDLKEQKFDLFRSKASHIIAIVCRYSGLVPEKEELCATACAVQNFWLSLNSLGFGGYWSTGNGTFSKENHIFHQLNDRQELLGYFIAGTPASPVAPSFRKPVEEHITRFN